MRTMNEENYGMGLLLHYIRFVSVDANEGWQFASLPVMQKATATKRQWTNQRLYTENILNILKH